MMGLGCGTLSLMAAGVLRTKLTELVSTRQKTIDREKVTAFVNASIVRDMEKRQYNQSIVVDL